MGQTPTHVCSLEAITALVSSLGVNLDLSLNQLGNTDMATTTTTLARYVMVHTLAGCLFANMNEVVIESLNSGAVHHNQSAVDGRADVAQCCCRQSSAAGPPRGAAMPEAGGLQSEDTMCKYASRPRDSRHRPTSIPAACTLHTCFHSFHTQRLGISGLSTH